MLLSTIPVTSQNWNTGSILKNKANITTQYFHLLNASYNLLIRFLYVSFTLWSLTMQSGKFTECCESKGSIVDCRIRQWGGREARRIPCELFRLHGQSSESGQDIKNLIWWSYEAFNKRKPSRQTNVRFINDINSSFEDPWKIRNAIDLQPKNHASNCL